MHNLALAQSAEKQGQLLGLNLARHAGQGVLSRSPIDGSSLATLAATPTEKVGEILAHSQAAFHAWRTIPAPHRGELIRLFAEELRLHKNELAHLVTLEAGKITQEALGEVQEMIDICDFAVGLSRQLYGLCISSERPAHRLQETWHPLGPVVIITAFNFPVAVWAWNAALALICGNSVIWKPSEKTPLTALATAAIFEQAQKRFGKAPAHLSQVVMGTHEVGRLLVADPRASLVSATGSTRMGREVGAEVAKRFGKVLLELGGNNAAIVCPSADHELAVRSIVFSAVGTAGQRCTSLRRLIVHESLYDEMLKRIQAAYAKVPIGDPLAAGTLVGPLIDENAFQNMQAALDEARAQGGKITGGERVMVPGYEKGYYVRPALVEMPAQTPVVLRETFAPILYLLRYTQLDEAIALNNAASHGLSSSIFTNDLREAERFLSVTGSDCGIANVNIGTSGAEIGGAFGGEKETGGGRESGTDSWRAYMRRATNTINFSSELPLAQGIRFDI